MPCIYCIHWNYSIQKKSNPQLQLLTPANPIEVSITRSRIIIIIIKNTKPEPTPLASVAVSAVATFQGSSWREAGSRPPRQGAHRQEKSKPQRHVPLLGRAEHPPTEATTLTVVWATTLYFKNIHPCFTGFWLKSGSVTTVFKAYPKYCFYF